MPPRGLSILLVNLRWPPHVAGGYELLAAGAADGLRARGHAVTVLCGQGSRLAESRELLPWLEPALDVDGRELDLFERDFAAAPAERYRRHFLSPRNLGATLRALERSRAERVLCFNLGLASRAPLVAARARGVPSMCWVADRWPSNHWLREWRASPAQRAAKPERLAWLAHYEAAFRSVLGATPLACVSAYIARELESDGYARTDLSVIPPPLRSALAAAARDARARPRESGAPLVVLCASMLWSGKGQHVLLEAAARACAAGARLELVIAGGGSDAYRAELEAQARSSELAGRVRFTGQLDAALLRAEYARAHVIASPSTWGEPLATAPLEGMLHALCCLLSDDGGGPETLAHMREGWIARRGDVDDWTRALLALERDDALRCLLANAGRARALAWPDEHAFAAALERALDPSRASAALGAPLASATLDAPRGGVRA